MGDLEQDFMGFVVIGPDHFLASGHPGAGQPGPADLGLIESTDGGRSWYTLSLSGEADFHALDYAHGRVYGLDSHTGQLMISDDKQTWQARPSGGAVDLAVSPQSPDEFLVTTSGGLKRSRDGGSTYQPVVDAPTMVYVSWPDTGPLIGVDPAGSLYASADGGETWQPRHRLADRPQAVFAGTDGDVFVATATAIYRSTDDAASVTEVAGVQ
ncbi:MAG: exo-alpha-sialidase [Actinomycetota bacterium]|nr:exo-alpha-sialidase [Actinomycetota bacterium]